MRLVLFYLVTFFASVWMAEEDLMEEAPKYLLSFQENESEEKQETEIDSWLHFPGDIEIRTPAGDLLMDDISYFDYNDEEQLLEQEIISAPAFGTAKGARSVAKASVPVSATGETPKKIIEPVNFLDFYDDFEEFDDSIWAHPMDEHFCPHPKIEQCVFITGKNNHWHRVPAKAHEIDSVHELHVSMKDDCNGPHCCEVLSVGGLLLQSQVESCTQYSTGGLTSKRSYLYGNFYFKMEAARSDTVAKESRDVWSCFSLLGYDSYGSNIHPDKEISLCIPSKERHRIILLWRFNDTLHHQIVNVNFDPGYVMMNFRITWHPSRIAWSANGKLLALITKQPHWDIPNTPMYIKTYLLPQGRDPKIEKEPVGVKTFTMYLDSIGYRALKEPHEELLTKEEIAGSLVVTLVLGISSCCLLGLGFYFWWSCAKEDVKVSDAYQMLLQHAQDSKVHEENA